jgi:hypothetical protein
MRADDAPGILAELQRTGAVLDAINSMGGSVLSLDSSRNGGEER